MDKKHPSYNLRPGFTLVELLVFIAIFSTIMVGFITMLIAVIRVNSRQSSANDVATQGQFLLQQIQYYVQSARLVDMTADVAYTSPSILQQAALINTWGCTPTCSQKFPNANATGSLLVAFLNWNSTTTGVSSLTDSAGNIWNFIPGTLATTTGYGGYSIEFAYAANAKGSASNTVTMTLAQNSGHSYILLYEYSGVATSSPLDQTATGQNASTTNAVTTTGQNGELVVVGAGGDNQISSWIPGSGFTTEFIDTGGGYDSYEDQVQSAPGPIAGSFKTWAWKNALSMATFRAVGGLKLRESNASNDPTYIYTSGGTVYLQQGTSGTPQPLTSNKVSVSNLSFTRHYNLNSSSTAYGTESVSYSFTMSNNVKTTSPAQKYSQSFQSAAAVLAPVPKIALVQQAKGEVNSTGVGTVSSTYPGNNATGSLLIAAVSNTGTSTAVFTIADTAGNTWTKIGNPTYAAYNQELTIFSALNAKNSSNTVTVSSGVNVNYPSLFIYEYRGAATSSSFNASSTQTQSSAVSVSSGSASPTSSVELLFGVSYSGIPISIAVPSAGTGFTLQSSSTVSNTTIEDANQYITGAVAATWTYSQVTSSSAFLATFK